MTTTQNLDLVGLTTNYEKYQMSPKINRLVPNTDENNKIKKNIKKVLM